MRNNNGRRLRLGRNLRVVVGEALSRWSTRTLPTEGSPSNLCPVERIGKGGRGGERRGCSHTSNSAAPAPVTAIPTPIRDRNYRVCRLIHDHGSSPIHSCILFARPKTPSIHDLSLQLFIIGIKSFAPNNPSTPN
jgi:hypothetical protein